MRDKNGTTQHCVTEQIGELAMVIPAAYHDGVRTTEPHFAKLAAAEFGVKISFAYTAGKEPRAWGHPDDYDDGTPAELSIQSIKADAAVHFDGDGVSLTASRGVDLLPLFSQYQIAALEDKLLVRAEAGNLE